MDCAPGTVKSRCARGRARLVPLLAQYRAAAAEPGRAAGDVQVTDPSPPPGGAEPEPGAPDRHPDPRHRKHDVTQPEHPSVEQISDLLAGVLPAAEAMDVNAHLASCEACRDERDRPARPDRPARRRGGDPPGDAAGRGGLDRCRDRSGQRRAGGRCRRSRLEPAQPAGGGRASRWRWLAGAAAAVVVVGVGFAGLRALPHDSSDDAGASAGHPPQSERRPEQRRGPAGHRRRRVRVRRRTDAGRRRCPRRRCGPRASRSARPRCRQPARRLAVTPADARRPRERAAAPRRSPVARRRVVRFKGHLAVLTITRDTRLATIYDCATATRTLFVTGY